MTKNKNDLARFEQCVLPHLDAAFNLARWLVGNHHDAQDIAQESCLRAWKYFNGFHGTDARAWLLTIVRNTSYTWLREYRIKELTLPIDEEFFDPASVVHEAFGESADLSATDPEMYLMQQVDDDSLEQLPVEFREVMILRELEELPYKQIAAITGVPVGTVMSRLARARKRLRRPSTSGAPVPAPKDSLDGL